MRPRCKISIPLICVAVVFAIALSIADQPALAQSPAASSQAASAAPSAVATNNTAPQPAAASSPSAAKPSTGAHTPDARAVISYLSDVINWYGHLGVEAQLVSDPDETLFFADDRQTAAEVVRLAFEYARAQAAFIARTSQNPAAPGPTSSPAAEATGTVAENLANVTNTLKKLEGSADTLSARLKVLQAQLAKAPAAKRAPVAAQIDGVQGQLDLNQARLNAFNALQQYESGSAAQDQSGSLDSQIDELEHSISASSKKTLATPADTLVASKEPTGIISLASELLALGTKLDSLDQNQALAQALSERAAAVRKSILHVITSLDARGNALAEGAAAADVAMLKERKQSFDNLLAEHKLLSAAAIPLSKQIVLLGIYTDNVGRWHDAVSQRRNRELRRLLIRLMWLAASLLLIFAGGLVWRWLTNRYVTDIRRRGQVMAARRLAIGLMILIVLLLNFSDEIGSAATVVGFAAAGI